MVGSFISDILELAALLRIAALFSGGKDSTFAIVKAMESGHDIACLISIRPASDESPLFHYPNTWLTRLQAEAIGIPLIELSVSDFSETAELQVIGSAFERAKSDYAIHGVVHGGIGSMFQMRIFRQACEQYGLELFSPLWQADPLSYMNELLESEFEILIVSVSAMGLDENWLGRPLDASAMTELTKLSSKYGFNLTFEGGEAETLVADCPLFSKKLVIRKSKKSWDGQRGIFEILEAELIRKDV